MARSSSSKPNRSAELPQDRTSEILCKHLDADFVVFPMAESNASPRDLDVIAAQFGVSFPPEFAAHVCGEFPGIYVEVKETIWPRHKAYAVGPFWSFLYGLHTFSPCSTSADWMRLDFVAREFRDEIGHPCVPILQIVGDANVYCVNRSGSIVKFDHEMNEVSPVAGNFWSIFEFEIAELKSRKMKKIKVRREQS